jgi:crossover junction endodeoxyribonuclease RusA
VLEITLPWPAREVWPNFRNGHHWRVYGPSVKAQRDDAAKLTLAVIMPTRPTFFDGKIPMEVNFYPPDHRNRDDDGCVGAFKSARDGIADALHVDDKRFRCWYVFHAPEKPGRIVARIG